MALQLMHRVLLRSALAGLMLAGLTMPGIALSATTGDARTGEVRTDHVRTIANDFGEARIEGTPQRVITLYQGATDTAVALGITPVGVVDSWLEKPMYRYLRPALKDVEHVGLETQPNLEKIAWLNPDLIIATRFRHAQVKPLLDKMAPTVAQRSVFDFKGTLQLMGEASGREQQATALLQDWEHRIADFRSKIAAKLGDEWPQKAAVVRFKSDHARVYSTGFAGSILDEIGFLQPKAFQDQGWGMKLTSMENIPVMNADVLFILMDESDPAIQANYRRWSSHPLWQQLDAVQHGRVYQPDPVTWLMGGGILAANAVLDDLYALYDLENDLENGLEKASTRGVVGADH